MTATPAAHGYAGPAGVFGWLLFDWAGQPFFTLVTTFVFAPYFASAVAPDPAAGQALWGFATGAAGLCIALLSPALGAIADAGGPKKPWIATFGGLMCLACVALWWVAPGAPGAVMLGLVAFALGTIGAEFAQTFNNAQMPRVVPPSKLGRLSGTGWAVGYVGGLVSLFLTLGFLAADPTTGQTLLGHAPAFGLDAATREGERLTGPLAALWFAVFVIPMFLFTPDAPRELPLRAAVRQGFIGLRRTIGHVRTHRNVLTFLAANMIYTDGLIALFAFGGIYAAGTFGWSAVELGVFGILLTVTGTAGALVGGWLDDRLGPKPVILGGLAVLALASVLVLSVGRDFVLFVIPAEPSAPGHGLYDSLPERLYVAFGLLIGAAAGPVQASSRALLAQLAPAHDIGQFFGLFSLSGKLTSFAGPTAVGLVTAITLSQRLGISVLVAFFAIGMALLARVEAPDVVRG
ncbi:MFS transporter [Blastochloris tepida]|uniref:MFS transporter n=1 Tax=Blastochloris tepida TaxID=2233851 RepID=A0A348G5A5_9HYPH|nr:MFS transporter [Blastochloris tepida]BBF94738.1 MFS transporter [Blastochloris tepida]